MDNRNRIPFDKTDAFGLNGKIFKMINDNTNIRVCVGTETNGLIFYDQDVSFEDLNKYWLKWNDTLKEWQPCNKVA